MTAQATKQTAVSQTLAERKENDLRRLMRGMKTVLVAFSGGVDSSYLSLVAARELGRDALCVTGISPSVSGFQRNEAQKIADEFGFNYEKIETEELANPDYAANPANRCYFCKTELYTKLNAIAKKRGIGFVLDGTNADDTGDYRPGREAARENFVRSPLVEVGMTKAEIREMSKKHGLPTWDKPASPCLSSRIAYGVPVSIERLSKVERGEEILRSLGFAEYRVRVHDELARLEVSQEEMERILSVEMAQKLSRDFESLGFRYVTIDLKGFRSGSLNETL